MKWSKMGWALSASSLVVMGTSLVPSTVADASVHTMRSTQIVLNGKTYSSPKAFTYQNTTYMPIYYVQNLLRSLGIENSWNGTSWNLLTQDKSVTLNLDAKTGTVKILVNGKTVIQRVTRIVDTDPYSHSPTSFIPIWYMQQVLKSMGLNNPIPWNGTVWNITANYRDVSKSGVSIGLFATKEDAIAKLTQYPGGVVEDAGGNVIYTQQDFTGVDLRFPAPSNVNAITINQFFAAHPSPLAGLGQSFMDAQSTYGVNANYLLAHAVEETGWGTSSIAITKNNLYGYGAYDANQGYTAGTFPTTDYAIRFQAWEVRNNYLNPGATYYVSPTLTGMNQHYASDTTWAANIGSVMNQFAIDQNDTVQSYVSYPSTQMVPTPQSSDEPVFYTSGYQGAVQQNSYYTGLPVYPDMATGESQMFTRPIQNKDSGVDVQALQTALNQQNNAGLTADGVFGPQTLAALQTYQSQHGLPTTGVCDFNMWTNDLHIDSTSGSQLSTGSLVSVDQMKQGMVGGDVVEWFHVVGQGWVDSNFVNLSNVYRLSVSDSTSATLSSVKVYDPNNSSAVISTMHAGDYVVSSSPAGVNGWVTIQFADQATGSTTTGVVSTSSVTLVKVGS